MTRAMMTLLAVVLPCSGCNGGRASTVAIAEAAVPLVDAAVLPNVVVDDDDGPDGGALRVAPSAPQKAGEPPALPAKVRISIRSSPHAAVVWGRKSLGSTPLSLERPRDSGPMDLVLYAKGYLPVHTRAYTFRNDGLSVDMTPISKQDTLLGARKAPPALPPSPDAGASSP